MSHREVSAKTIADIIAAIEHLSDKAQQRALQAIEAVPAVTLVCGLFEITDRAGVRFDPNTRSVDPEAVRCLAANSLQFATRVDHPDGSHNWARSSFISRYQARGFEKTIASVVMRHDRSDTPYRIELPQLSDTSITELARSLVDDFFTQDFYG